MPGYRCLNNPNGYCIDTENRTPGSDNPAFVNAGGVHQLEDTSPASCTLDPLICGFFSSWGEVCHAIKPIEE
ncbi:hypothetical protein ES705_48685 [subsurface metagenome]